MWDEDDDYDEPIIEVDGQLFPLGEVIPDYDTNQDNLDDDEDEDQDNDDSIQIPDYREQALQQREAVRARCPGSATGFGDGEVDGAFAAFDDVMNGKY